MVELRQFYTTFIYMCVKFEFQSHSLKETQFMNVRGMMGQTGRNLDDILQKCLNL